MTDLGFGLPVLILLPLAGALAGIAVASAFIHRSRGSPVDQRAIAPPAPNRTPLPSPHELALLRCSQHVMSGLDLDASLRRIVEEACRIAATPHAKILLVDSHRQVLRAGAASGRPMPPEFELPVGAGYSGTVAATERPLFVRDVQRDPANVLVREDRALGIVTYLGLPVAAAGEMLGVLSFNTEEPREYSSEDLAMLARFADMAAVAIQNARLYGAAQEQARELRALHDVRTTLASTLDTSSALQAIADSAVRLTGAAASAVFELDARHGLLHCRAALPAGSRRIGSTVLLGEGAAGRAALTRVPAWSDEPGVDGGAEDAPEAGGGAAMPEVPPAAYRAVLSVPLEHRESVHGAICLYWDAAHRASDREVRLLTTFGEDAAAALEQGRLRDALAARVKSLETLTRLSQLISSSLDRDDVLREIVSAATRLMNVPFAVIWVADEARGVVDLAAWSDPAIVADFPFRSLRGDRGIVGWIAEHRLAVNVADVFEDLRFVALDWWRAHQMRSFYGIPVVLDGCLLAVIELHGRDPIEPGPEERQLLDGFVAQAAVAIRNASMYRAEGEARMAAERALAQVNRLQGLLPICSYCKKIRNDRNYWEQIDTYISERSDAAFTHGICPECHETIVAPQLAEWRAAQAAGLTVDD